MRSSRQQQGWHPRLLDDAVQAALIAEVLELPARIRSARCGVELPTGTPATSGDGSLAVLLSVAG